jgi:MFS family permease
VKARPGPATRRPRRLAPVIHGSPQTLIQRHPATCPASPRNSHHPHEMQSSPLSRGRRRRAAGGRTTDFTDDRRAIKTASVTRTESAPQEAWLPLIVAAMTQVLMSFNVNALSVSIGGIIASFDTSPTIVGTAIVTYSLFVAAFVMLGARIRAFWGTRPVFHGAVALFGLAMLIMALSPTAAMLIVAQATAGAAAAALVPTLVVLLAANYQGRQQEQAFGWIGASEVVGGVLAFRVAGFRGALIGWRYSFGLSVILAGCVFFLGSRLKPVDGQRGLEIDRFGIVLAALAIMLISLSFSNINRWRPPLLKPAAPLGLLGMSPAPAIIFVGIVLGQAFFAWSRKRKAEQKMPLIALQVIETGQQ